MFVVDGTAQVQQVIAWGGRQVGYHDLLEHPVVVSDDLPERPTQCFVCKSTNLGYARVLDAEERELRAA